MNRTIDEAAPIIPNEMSFKGYHTALRKSQIEKNGQNQTYNPNHQIYKTSESVSRPNTTQSTKFHYTEELSGYQSTSYLRQRSNSFTSLTSKKLNDNVDIIDGGQKNDSVYMKRYASYMALGDAKHGTKKYQKRLKFF